MSVRHALLALLSEGPKYGQQLQQEFEQRTGEVWPLNVGQVYSTLQRLERDELIDAPEGGGEGQRRRFELTETGARELDQWLHSAGEASAPPRDELLIKVLIALRLPEADVHEILQTHRRHLIELMQRYTQLKTTAADDDLGLTLVLDAELFRLEAAVRWLDVAEARLRQRPLPPSVAAPSPARHASRKRSLR